MQMPSPGEEMGPLAKKVGWKEKCMDSRSLAPIWKTEPRLKICARKFRATLDRIVPVSRESAS